jgi:Ion channel
METALFTSLGAAILLLTAYDAHSTILHSRGRNGPLAQPLVSFIWHVARAIAFRSSPEKRHKKLNSVGPWLMPVLITIYVLLLILGFALIYYPRMPDHFLVAPEAQGSRWVSSLYFSGVTLTTIGFGDITPRTNGMRLLSFAEAASGLGLISLAISYLITVYRALERKRAAALAFYIQADGGADAVSFIANHKVADKLSGLPQTLRTASRDLQETLESHIEHPIIHYFHPVEIYKGLPRMLFLSLEICAVLRSCLDREEYADIQQRAEVRMLESSALHVLEEFVEVLKLQPRQPVSPSDRPQWLRQRFEMVLYRLNKLGIKTTPDSEVAWTEYSANRDQWEDLLNSLAHYLGYDWSEVTSDVD